MALIYTINNTRIETADVVKKNSIEQKVNFNGQDLIAAKMTITLDNTDRSKYDDQTAGSLFYGVSWYNGPVSIYDTTLGIMIWVGRIKAIKVDDGSQTLDVETTNWLKTAVDTTCTYMASDVTPMAAVEAILSDEDQVNIDPYWLNQYTFNYVKGFQSEKEVTIDISFTQEKNQNCLQAIEELCRISHSSLYLRHNVVYALQYEPYTGQKGTIIEPGYLLPGSYRHWYDPEEVYTDTLIRYKESSGAAVLSKISDVNTTAVNKGYPKKSWNIPDVDNGTDPGEYPILLNNAAGAAWVAAMALERWGEPSLMGEFSIGEEVEVLPGSQVDLNFRTFIREPLLVTEHVYDPGKHEIKMTGIFRNLPVRKYSPDVDPPETPAIVSVLYLASGSRRVLFTVALDADSYEMYFSNSAGSWITSFSDQGISHLVIREPGLTEDGYHFVDITGLQEGLRYWYKARAIDAALNPSEYSNIFEALQILSVYENQYYLQGDVWTGLSLGITNPEGGTPPDTEVLYGDAVYGIDHYGLTAYYLSPIYRLKDYTLFSYTGQGTVIMQYRTSSNNVTWGPWSADIPVDGDAALDITSAIYFQFRVIFASVTWSDSDTFQLKEIR